MSEAFGLAQTQALFDPSCKVRRALNNGPQSHAVSVFLGFMPIPDHPVQVETPVPQVPGGSFRPGDA